MAADRFGERIVLATGLGAAAACLAGAAFVSSFAGLVVLLVPRRGLGASVSASTGRAVMHWFGARHAGFALGVRQTSVPIAGFWVALVLPALVVGRRPARALLALAAVVRSRARSPGSRAPRQRRRRAGARAVARPAPLPRPRRSGCSPAASALILEPQVCLVGFLVVFLHGERGLSTAAAGAVLAVVNALGIATRIGAGRWSDLVRQQARAAAAIALGCAALVAAHRLRARRAARGPAAAPRR